MKLIIYMFFFTLGSWGLAAGLFFPAFRWEMFLGMIAPLVIGLLTLFCEKKIYDRNPEDLTPFMLKAFAGKMIFYGAYFICIFTFYSFNPIPFIITFLACFITLHTIEALFLKSILK